MYVTNDPSVVRRLSGFDSWRHCLPPKLAIDSFRSKLPLLVTGERRKPVIVAKEIDRTNLEGLLDPRVNFVFHSPYFTFDGVEQPSTAHADLGTALRSLSDGRVVKLDPRLPVQLYGDLNRALEGSVRAPIGCFIPPAHRYLVTESKNVLPSSRSDPEVRAAADHVVDDLGASPVLHDWLERPPDNRFAVLDSLLDDIGIDAILASNPVNVQQLSGIPSTLLPDQVYALYVNGSRSVEVYSRQYLAWFGLPEAETLTSGSIGDRLRDCRVGVEEEDLSQEAFDGLGLSSLIIAPATTVLRRWRELRTWEDLSYYVLGAHVTLTAIEAALRLVAGLDGTSTPANEMDAYRRYREVVADEVEKARFAIRVRPYFTHTHAGNRSLIPANATDHVLRPLSTLKIDAGLEVYDEHGFLRAATDVARSVTGNAAAADFYARLDQGLTDIVIDACRPGRTGDDVFQAATDWLEPQRGELVAAGFAPATDLPFSAILQRDVGHLLGKQEPATVVFAKGNDRDLRPGMVAAAEFQWPFRDNCFGVEDMFLVTEGEPVNLTRESR
jgi:Xaa-Pro aminopeptidase